MSTDITPTNGSTTSIPKQSTPDATASRTTTDYTSYRPPASMDTVRREVERGLGGIVREALDQASHFVFLAYHSDRDAEPSVRHGHLVDATECMEIAFTHLGMVKAAINHRMVSDHAGTDPRYWPINPRLWPSEHVTSDFLADDF